MIEGPSRHVRGNVHTPTLAHQLISVFRQWWQRGNDLAANPHDTRAMMASQCVKRCSRACGRLITPGQLSWLAWVHVFEAVSLHRPLQDPFCNKLVFKSMLAPGAGLTGHRHLEEHACSQSMAHSPLTSFTPDVLPSHALSGRSPCLIQKPATCFL